MSGPHEPEIAALLLAERGHPGPGASTRGRVLARVQQSVAIHPPSGPAPRMPSAASVPGGLLRPLLAGALLIGAGTVALLASRLPQATVATAPTVAPPEPAPSVPPSPEIAPLASVPVAPTPEPSPPAGVEAPKLAPPVSALPAERAILDRARKDLLSGEPGAALQEVATHARLYPRGVLGEERDALRVEALVAAGSYEPARAAGARFRAAYPGSMLAPAVEDALRAIP